MSRGTKTVLRWLLACGAVAALLYAGWWSLCEWYVVIPFGYSIEAEFAELPPDDEALKAWLEQQPGVTRVFAITRGEARKTIKIDLLMEQNAHYKPRFPDVEKACAELGYKGRVERFRDTERRAK
jgi:hypothetical protein